MTDFNQKEYQAVILGALLHDIGKFYQRAGREKGDHQHLGDQCFEEYFAERLSKLLSFEEIGIIRNAINNHHEYAEYITLADGLSAGMDRIDLADYETGDPVKERLQSVFQKIFLGHHIPTENYRYCLRPLSLNKKDIFPILITENTVLTDEYRDLWDGFKNGLGDLQIYNLSSCINSIYHLLWKYTWCVPGAVYKSEPDVSLFDHLKTTSAIAGCLYAKRKSNEQDNNEFLLFGGDISGIQKFIYKITKVQNVKGVSKRLRGRSFYLSLLQEVTAFYFLNRLSLSIPHLLFCGGGRFEILLPNTTSIKNELENIVLEINEWLLDEYAGELGLVTAWVIANQEGIKNYADLLKELDNALSFEKKRKFKEFFMQDSFWIEDKKINGEIRVCRSCNTTTVKKGIDDEICKLCNTHKKIGERLPKTEYIAYLSYPNSSIGGLPIPFGRFGSVYLISGNYDKSLLGLQEVITIQRVNETAGEFKFIGNVAPIAKKDFEQETEEDDQDSKKIAKAGNVLTFETIADMSIGDKRLGVLKMDVDYLGLIFSIGLVDEHKEKQKSISRVATISRGMDWFFAGYLNDICKSVFEDWKKNAHKAGWEEKAYKIENIFYIVYSGGDDLLIIGPWSEIPKVAKAIRDEFKEYTCNNPDINISAGVFFYKPKYPISLAAKGGSEQLETSKDKGRKRITLFGDTVEWVSNDNACLDGLLSFGEDLYQYITNDALSQKLPRGFVHGLLRKHKQYNGGQDYRFIPAITYHIVRNVKDYELRKELKAKLITDKNGYFKHIKISASYALLKSRKED